MSTHNICFRGEIRKIFTRYPSLSRPMVDHEISSVVILPFYSFKRGSCQFLAKVCAQALVIA